MLQHPLFLFFGAGAGQGKTFAFALCSYFYSINSCLCSYFYSNNKNEAASGVTGRGKIKNKKKTQAAVAAKSE
jgi:hypothetical protein